MNIKILYIFISLLLFTPLAYTNEIKPDSKNKQELDDKARILSHLKMSYSFRKIGSAFLTPGIFLSTLAIPGSSLAYYHQWMYKRKVQDEDFYRENKYFHKSSYEFYTSATAVSLSLGLSFTLSSLILLALSEFYEFQANQILFRNPSMDYGAFPAFLKPWPVYKKLSRISLILFINATIVCLEGLALFIPFIIFNQNKELLKVSDEFKDYYPDMDYRIFDGYHELYWSSISLLFVGLSLELTSLFLLISSRITKRKIKRKNNQYSFSPLINTDYSSTRFGLKITL